MFLVTINHTRVKESPNKAELVGVLDFLHYSLKDWNMTHWVFEIGPVHKQLHCHAIATFKGRFKKCAKHMLNNGKLFRIHFRKFPKRDIERVKGYMRKTGAHIFSHS